MDGKAIVLVSFLAHKDGWPRPNDKSLSKTQLCHDVKADMVPQSMILVFIALLRLLFRQDLCMQQNKSHILVQCLSQTIDEPGMSRLERCGSSRL